MKDKLTHAESVMLLVECQDIMVEQETSIAALQAEIDKRDNEIAALKHLVGIARDFLVANNMEDCIFMELSEEVVIHRAHDRSTLKTHDREVKIKCLEEAAAHFADTPKGREVRAELLYMADELRSES